ncbi:MAG: hypothetical protein GY863_01200, partial [bacterium]|nr:hypothetical protein [bacterium]
FNKKGHSPLLYVMDDDGKLVRGVGNVIYERDMYINLVKNNGYFCIDDDGNYYVTYKSLNRIQKHGPDGKILFRSERPLNFTTDVLAKTRQRKRGNSTITDYPKMNKVSGAIAVDSKKRIWVATYKRQIKDDEKISVAVTESDNTAPLTEIYGNTDVLETDMFVLEIFSSEGVLIGKIQLGHFMDDIRIFGDRLYVLDKFRSMQYYVYKIDG